MTPNGGNHLLAGLVAVLGVGGIGRLQRHGQDGQQQDEQGSQAQQRPAAASGAGTVRNPRASCRHLTYTVIMPGVKDTRNPPNTG